MYWSAQTFLRVEAVGTRSTQHGEPADPVHVEVRITDSEGAEILRIAKGEQLWRATTGTWIVAPPVDLFEPGKGYTIHWRYSMIPGVIHVARSNFVWEPLPAGPRLPGNVVLWGTLKSPNGVPQPGSKVVVEEYHDYGTLTRRLSQQDVVADSWGNWFIEAPQGKILRLVFGDVVKIVRLPEAQRVGLDEIPAFQPRDIVRRDRYGYPVPGQDLLATLARRLTEREALAVLQSVAVVRYIEEHSDTTVRVEGGAEIYVHEQVIPVVTWIIVHGKGGTPVVSVIDTNGDVMHPDVSYPDNDTVVLSFNAPMAGKAVLICGEEHPITG